VWFVCKPTHPQITGTLMRNCTQTQFDLISATCVTPVVKMAHIALGNYYVTDIVQAANGITLQYT